MPVQIRRAYADSPWGQLHYRVAAPPGDAAGPPLLCLHQTPKSGWEFEPVMALLGESRLVIAADTPGYGASDGPAEPVTIEAYAEVMAGFMSARAAVFDVMGIHTGAVLAAQLARAYPNAVRRAVLVGLAAYEADVRAEKLERLKAYPKPKADLSHVESIWGVMQTLFDARTSVAWRHRSLAENLRAGEGMSWGYEAVYRFDFLAALEAVRQPVLVINPEDDLSAITPVAAARLPNARRVDFPGTKHGIFAVETERVAQVVDQFLSEAG